MDKKITACMMIMNEEYWIYYILRELTQVFPVLIYDTGSTDSTCDIIKKYFPGVDLKEVGKLKPEKLGKLREEIFNYAGYPIFMIDGDEYYPINSLKKIKSYIPEEGKTLGFTHLRSIGLKRDNILYEREGKSNDCVFLEPVEWSGSYPSEHHSLWPQSNKYFYFPMEFFGFHLRYLPRSSQDKIAYARISKFHKYEPTANKGNITLQGIFGEINPEIPNFLYDRI